MKKNLLFLAAGFLIFFACNRESADPFIESGLAKYEKKDIKGALEDFTRATEAEVNNATAWYNKANMEGMLNMTKEAEESYDRAVELNPKYGEAYANRAFYVKEKMQDWKGALDDYNQAIELGMDKAKTFSYNNMGYVKFKLNDITGALQDVKTSISRDSSNPYAYRNLALIFEALGKKDTACINIQKALAKGFTEKYGTEAEEISKRICEPAKPVKK